jgi:[acyl-carrier-protein] S-malonyltransferase
MGKNLPSKRYLDADAIVGFGLTQLMLEGPEDKLRDTAVTQPALFVTSAVACDKLAEKGIQPSFVAGHSLGEYSALYAAGVLTFDDALRLVVARGRAMQEAAAASQGTMAAILGLKADQIKQICNDVTAGGDVCAAANFNSDVQTVISGSVSGVNKAMELAKAAGAAKTVPLSVSGAFHSPLMKPAAEKLKLVIDKTPFADAKVPVITNVDAKATTSAADFKRKLVEQIDHSVLWDDSLRVLLGAGAEAFIEVGAGKVLSSMIKRLDRSKTAVYTDDFETLEKSITQTI